MSDHSRQQLRRWIVSAVGIALLAVCSLPGTAAQEPAETAALSGFTRLGNPSDTEKDGSIMPAALDETVRHNGIGGTVYFMVLERLGVSDDDVWASKLEDFQTTFKPGVDVAGASSPELDTGAKYLYLYQLVNDRKTLSPIESTSIKLLADLKDITSWGYFSGIGFATMKEIKKQDKSEIRPVSSGNLVLGDKKSAFYQDNAPAVVVPDLLRLAYVPTRKGEKPGDAIKLAKGVVQIQWDALDPAVNPDFAMLLNKSDFDSEPSFRVIWSNKNLIPAEGRSTAFGFTCNFPPTFEKARIRGKKVEDQGDGKIAPVKVSFVETGDKLEQQADGKAATPKPDKSKAPAEAPVRLPASGTGGGGAPAPAASGSGGAAPAASAPAAGVGGSAAAAASGSGSGSGGGGSGQQQVEQQKQQQQGGGKIDINNLNQQQQQQKQQQQQRQKQQQNQNQKQNQGNGGGHEVIPAPAAVLLAALGLPALVLIRRRRCGMRRN